ncbi:HD domain-containing protein [Paenibacillus pini]
MAAKDYVKAELENEPSGHDWWHIYRVSLLAIKLARSEGADEFVCELAALLHDLADEKLVESKNVALGGISEWLTSHKVDSPTIEHIIEIISTMSYAGGGGAQMTTLEGRVVQDADRLDAIGAIGIARTFAYAGAKGNLIYNPDKPARMDMTPEQYRNEPGTAINHFDEKLLKLNNLLNTESARMIGEKRHSFMEQFLTEFYAEWNVQ